MLLYAIYRNTKKVIEEKLPDHIKSIVILSSTLGTSEVYPVDTQPYAEVGEVNKDAKKPEQTEDREKSMETAGHHELQAIECAV